MSESTATKHDGRAVLFAVADLLVLELGLLLNLDQGYIKSERGSSE